MDNSLHLRRLASLGRFEACRFPACLAAQGALCALTLCCAPAQTHVSGLVLSARGLRQLFARIVLSAHSADCADGSHHLARQRRGKLIVDVAGFLPLAQIGQTTDDPSRCAGQAASRAELLRRHQGVRQAFLDFRLVHSVAVSAVRCWFTELPQVQSLEVLNSLLQAFSQFYLGLPV